MYSTFAARNFRSLTNLKIENLERINLFTGRNGVGKTALLEALWIHHAPNVPDLARRVNVFRGMPQVDVNTPFWDLFTAFNTKLKIELDARGTWGKQPRVLRIYVEELREVEVKAAEPALSGSGVERSTFPLRASRNQIVFEYMDEHAKVMKSSARVVERQVSPAIIELGLVIQAASIGKEQVGIFLPAHRHIGKEDVDRFSKLELARQQEKLVEVLRLIDPRIKRLSVIVQEGIPLLHADIGADRLFPTALLGDGISRLLSIGLAISSAPEGIVLVDEVENGIYYGVMADVWQGIAAFARDFDVQVFATTHSRECIESAYRAFSKADVFDFRLHRIERRDDQVRAVTYDKDTLGVALESGLEVR